MTFKLYNTLSRSIEEFKPLNPEEVKIYCCGPTVYNYQHIGNFRTFLNEDTLRRTLNYAGYKTKHVMNITDVGHLASDADDGEDKMLMAAKREKKKSYEIADFYTKIFFEDWDKLHLIRPDVVCKATDHIKEMIELTKTLESKGFAYVANGNVYFDTAKVDNYGELARLKLEQQQAGTNIEVDTYKKNPNDFVLWFTNSKFENHELLWDSPWGAGYPGWHIECSAMSMKYLGDQFDIHCGGIDHIPVHHTNEIAQTEAATGKPWVKYWVHSEFALINDEKISKSKNNFIQLSDLEKEGYEPEAFRLLVLGSHYRKHMPFTKESMSNASISWLKLKSAIIKLRIPDSKQSGVSEAQIKSDLLTYSDEFKAAIFNDLNTPLALASIWKVLGSDLPNQVKLGLLYSFDNVLGLNLEAIEEKTIDIPEELDKLLKARILARANKDWKESDRIRTEITNLGYLLEDSSEGQKVSKL